MMQGSKAERLMQEPDFGAVIWMMHGWPILRLCWKNKKSGEEPCGSMMNLTGLPGPAGERSQKMKNFVKSI